MTANADFSYSAWFNYTGPTITGANRYFVLETIHGDTVSPTTPSGTEAWTASLGLRNFTSGTLTVNAAEYFTHPSVAWARSTYAVGWNNAIVTFDADGGSASGGRMTAYMNGIQVGFRDNVASTTAVSGLVVGGHREGTGRNFDGLIDDIAFFDDILTSNEISRLQTMDAFTAVPEPGSALLLAVGSSLLMMRRRRKG